MPKSKILPTDFVLHTRDDVRLYYDQVISQPINSVDDLKRFIDNTCDLDDYLSEDYARRYIKQSCNTLDQDLKKHYEEFVDAVQPDRSKTSDLINKLIVASPYTSELEWPYAILLRWIKRSIEVYREENVPLEQEVDKIGRAYSELVSKMTIEHNGEELTMKQASKFLKEKDRNLRKVIWDKMVTRKAQDYDAIDAILDKLISLRTKMAQNAWFTNFADFKHFALQRFDYTLDDIYAFHQSIYEIISPLAKSITEHRRKVLWHELKPYDFAVSIFDKSSNECYKDSSDLVEKIASSLNSTFQWFGDFIKKLSTLGQLDLTTRKGKGPGGYNYPLSTSDSSFIFMNAVNDSYGMFTMLHEAWHALHHHYTYWIEPSASRHPWSEVCEIASMAQELLSLDKLENFFENKQDYTIASMEKLEDDILTFPWIAKIDLFQQRLYKNPNHTHEERNHKRWELAQQYANSSGLGQYDSWIGDYENALLYRWQGQMHIFDLPMYYIEYAIAGLAAIAMWKNYLEIPEQWIQNYINLLKVGNTKTMPEIFETWGIKFDFSREYVQELMNFMHTKLEEYYNKLW